MLLSNSKPNISETCVFTPLSAKPQMNVMQNTIIEKLFLYINNSVTQVCIPTHTTFTVEAARFPSLSII